MEKNEESAVNECICAIQQILGDMTITEGKSLIALGESLIKYGEVLIGRGQRRKKRGQAKKEQYSVDSTRNSRQGLSVNTHQTDYTPQVQQPKPQIDDILVLFVKAESGSNLLREIAANMQLHREQSEDLYLNVINIWMGSTKDFNTFFASSFNQKENRGESALLDFVMLKIDLQIQYAGLRKGNTSIERINAIGKLCDDNVCISQISQRLNFGVFPANNLIWEK
ncbi:MAG: hypothetical protein J6R79_02690 [Bacteroidaceae bacterium]|nr:hypothetical protein [Bacteroidaceae bacterium]